MSVAQLDMWRNVDASVRLPAEMETVVVDRHRVRHSLFVDDGLQFLENSEI